MRERQELGCGWVFSEDAREEAGADREVRRRRENH